MGALADDFDSDGYNPGEWWLTGATSGESEQNVTATLWSHLNKTSPSCHAKSTTIVQTRLEVRGPGAIRNHFNSGVDGYQRKCAGLVCQPELTRDADIIPTVAAVTTEVGIDANAGPQGNRVRWVPKTNGQASSDVSEFCPL